MKLARNSKEALKLIKKAKKGDVVIFDESSHPDGELWRKSLRLLALEFLSDDILKRGLKNENDKTN